jgi:hypothetical protein
VNRLIILILSLFLLNNCSLNENSKIWKEKEKNLENKNIEKVFLDKKIITSEFNQELKLDLVKFNLITKLQTIKTITDLKLMMV